MRPPHTAPILFLSALLAAGAAGEEEEAPRAVHRELEVTKQDGKVGATVQGTVINKVLPGGCGTYPDPRLRDTCLSWSMDVVMS